MKKSIFLIFSLLSFLLTNELIATDAPGEVIGFTTYDLQSNSSIGNRITNHGNGQISVVYTMALEGGSYPDRGTGYNFFDGTDWGSIPFERLEDFRSGWPNVGETADGRIFVISHMAPLSPSSTGEGFLFSYLDPGATDWVSNQILNPNGTTLDPEAVWTKAVTVGNTIHAIGGRLNASFNGVEGGLNYIRSTDAGDNWESILLAGMNPEEFSRFAGDAYAIHANGENIAIVGQTFGPTLWTSSDGGSTWEYQVLKSNGNQTYNIQDASSGDLDAGIYSDGSFEVMIDDNGTTHVWYGRLVCADFNSNALGNNDGIFNPDYTTSQALMYWNSTMNGEPVTLGETVIQDLTGDCLSTVEVNRQHSGLVSGPSAGRDADGNLYVVYATPTDGDLDFEGEPFRDLHLIKSLDGGNSWIGPINITNTTGEDCFYGAMADLVDDHVHIVYQTDYFTGTFLEGTQTDVTNNEIVYLAVPVGDIVSPTDALNTCPNYGRQWLDMYAITGCDVNYDRAVFDVIDYPDGDITDQVTYTETFFDTEGDYVVFADVADSDGNPAYANENPSPNAPAVPDSIDIIVIEDTEPPIIISDLTSPIGVLPGNTDFVAPTLEDADILDFVFYPSFIDSFSVLSFKELDSPFIPNLTDTIFILFTDELGCPSILNLTIEPPFDINTIGTYTFTYTAVDYSGNEAEPLVIIVNVEEDNAPPQLTITDINGNNVEDGGTVIYEANPAFIDVGIDYSAFDNIDGDLTDAVVVTYGSTGPPYPYSVGTFMVTYTVMDSAGNTTSYTITVEVIDTTPPNFTLIASNTFDICAGDELPPDGDLFILTDNFISAGSSIEDLVTSSGTIDLNEPGEYVLQYNAVDPNGVESPVTYQITYVVCLCDASGNCDVAPVLTVTDPFGGIFEDGSLFFFQGNPALEDVGITFSAFDGLDGDLTDDVVVTYGPNGPPNPGILGFYTITYTVTDLTGNTTSITITVEVFDSIPPDFLLIGANTFDLCLGDELPADGDLFTLTDNFIAVGSSIEDLVASSGTIDLNEPGEYVLEYAAVDPNGIASPVTYLITYLVCVCDASGECDVAAPVLTLTDQSGANLEDGDTLVFEADPALMDVGITFAASDDTAGDLTDAVVINYGPNGPPNPGELGTYTTTYTVVDNAGNITEYTITVEVVDTTPPVFTLLNPNDIELCVGGVLPTENTLFTLTDAFIDSMTDISELISANTIVDVNEPGTYVMEYSAMDPNGNMPISNYQLTYVVCSCDANEECVVGLEAIQLLNSISLSPNPSNGRFVLKFKEIETLISIDVFNIQGQTMMSKEPNNNRVIQMDIDLTAYPNGLYFVRIKTDHGTLVKKLVLEK